MAGKFRCILLLCFLCLFAGGASSSKLNPGGVPDAAAQGGSSFNLRVDVDLVTIEVIALDKKDKPMRNLKKEDFRLYEDGKKQEILSFDEVSGDSAISSLGITPLNESGLHRGKTVLIVFDDSTIPQEYIKKSRDSAARFVREHMKPQDLFGVASFGMSMKILQNLTGDREDVLAAVGQTATSNASGTFYFEEFLRALEQINYSMARLKGPKSVLIYGRIGYFSSLDVQTIYGKTLDSARKSNVVYYTVDPSTSTGSGPGAEMGSRSPVGFNTPMISGTGPSMPPGGDIARGGGLVPATLRSLATASGGYAIIDTNNIDAELDQLDKQISNYYILGFQSDNPKHDGVFRKVEVKTDLKGVTLKYRPGYQDRRPIDVLASSKQEQKLLTALATPGAATQLPVVFRPAYFYDSPRTARVLIAARIRMDNVTFKKKGGQIGTDLSIMGVANAEDGSIAARFSETLPVSFDKEREAEFRKGNLAYRNYFKLRPGKYLLKLAVSDESSNLGSTEQSLELPAFPNQGFAGSSLVLAEQKSRLPDLIKNLQTQMLDQSDPLIYSGMQTEPRVENSLPVSSTIPVLFRLYNLPDSPDQWDLAAKAKLLDEKGGELALQPIPLKAVISPAGKGEAVVALNLPFQSAAPGKYRLVIEITQAGSAEAATLQTDLELR
jgi:VWFA-related protein